MGINTIIIPILQMRKVGHGEVKSRAKHLISGRPGILAPAVWLENPVPITFYCLCLSMAWAQQTGTAKGTESKLLMPNACH